MTKATILKGGLVVDGTGTPEFGADLVIRGDSIESVEPHGYAPSPGDEVVDCGGLLLMPGFIDAHCHADGAVFEERVALGLLREGVTTVICGQDGVSYAPGDGSYATEYFGALNGPHPHYRGSTVAELLATYDQASAVNVGYLVPHGTVRHEVMGMENRAASEAELEKMADLVSAALEDGALGMSTGLDYVPGLYADAAELARLCLPVAAAQAIYVTHMRGGYESNAHVGIAEIREIVAASAVSVHVSHFHGPAEIVGSLVHDALRDGVDLSFDTYPYRRGSSLLAMPVLPPDIMSRGNDHVIAVLSDPEQREELADRQRTVIAGRSDMGPDWPKNMLLSYIASPGYSWAEGMTVQEAADRAGADPVSFSLELLAESKLAVAAVFKVPEKRAVSQLASLMRNDVHMTGSDGIYTGTRPHPRGWGAFARMLATFTRERGDYSWSMAAQHLSANAAARHGLGDRGRLTAGSKADVVLVDQEKVRDRARYAHPTTPAVGIDTVIVNGVFALRGGELTGNLAGRGLRRSAPVRPIGPLRSENHMKGA